MPVGWKVTQIETYPTRLTILNVEPGIIVSTDYTAITSRKFFMEKDGEDLLGYTLPDKCEYALSAEKNTLAVA